MPVLLALSWLAFTAALSLAVARRSGRVDLEGITACIAASIAFAACAATLLAWAGGLAAAPMTAILAIGIACARVCTPARSAGVAPAAPGGRRVELALGLGVVALGLGLRQPAIEHPLAGRDQGTYELLAAHAARTGTLELHDPILHAAATEARERSGPMDLLGLLPIARDGWRTNVYEGAYRPGLYLVDRDRGLVAPQFLQLHPMAHAVARLALGPLGSPVLTFVESAALLLAFWAVARRLLGPFAGTLALALLCLSPLAIWVHRNALSESLASLLTWSAVALLVRDREGGGDRILPALLLGAVAWTRGNALLTGPVLLLLASIDRGRDGRAPALVLALALASSLAIHAAIAFPYLHDELLRQTRLPIHPSPLVLAAAAAIGLLGWWIADLRLPRGRVPSAVTTAVVGRAPAYLVAVLAGVVITHAIGAVARSGPPFARLDALVPMLGWPLLVAAGLGAAIVGLELRTRARGNDPWLLGVAAGTVVTAGLYAQTNLPKLHFFYYGRYLVPELLPAACLLAALAVRRASTAVALTRARATAVGTALGLGLLASTAAALVLHPIVRLREFEGSDRLVDRIAAATPADAIVIAGGEGWHASHTFNQVGGALVLAHGRSVLPYRDPAAAYAALHELLIARPQSTGASAPPVFLLLDEPTRPRPEPGLPKIAAFDALVPAPFRAATIALFEAQLLRLTPTATALPTEVTRVEQRMALIRVEVDAALAAATEHYRFRDGAIAGPRTVSVRGKPWRKGHACLRRGKPVTIEIPEDPSAAPGARQVVVVLAPGSAADNEHLAVRIDGRDFVLRAPGAQARERDTLGPFAVPGPPRRIELRGFDRKIPAIPCPHGELGEIRVLPMTGGGDPVTPTTDFVAPDADLGHPFVRTRWTAGRAVSRLTPGFTTPTPETRGPSLRITGERPLQLPEVVLPAHGTTRLDLVLTLTGGELPPDARVRVSTNGTLVAEIDPPDAIVGTWQSAPTRWNPGRPTAAFEVALASSDDAWVHLRDVGLFSSVLTQDSALPEP